MEATDAARRAASETVEAVQQQAAVGTMHQGNNGRRVDRTSEQNQNPHFGGPVLQPVDLEDDGYLCTVLDDGQLRATQPAAVVEMATTRSMTRMEAARFPLPLAFVVSHWTRGAGSGRLSSF